ncbi:tetratricopeptide repeat protein [Amycolatopsis cihanbeyliensis]|uniref:tetratricopeptide repeat protein n=1 Tax=Amycolatopsis cihanbeyliensis TaxID=1128664 RepID=UPI0011522B6E|nr:tetratricopeptide repeat protein [Amycolatopsis cihanbeyliensis]
MTEEQIAAAQLRIVLDEKLGRQTTDDVREIAASTASAPPEQQTRPEKVEDNIVPPASKHSPAVTATSEDETSLHDVVTDVRRSIESHPRWPFQGRREAIETFDEMIHNVGKAVTLVLRASEASDAGDYVRAERLLQQAVHAFRTIGRRGEGLADINLAATYQLDGQHQRAIKQLDSHIRGTGPMCTDDRGRAHALLARSRLHLLADQAESARHDAEEALKGFQELEDLDAQLAAQTMLSEVYTRLDQSEEALKSEQRATEIRQALGLSSE